MLTGRDIVCISSIDWDFIWQGHQEIMSTLAERGNRVLFVENTGVRSPTFRDLPRLRHRLYNWWRGTKGFREERENLFVYSPLVLPFPYSRIARWINRWLLVRALQRWMHAMGCRRPLVWTFLPTPLARDVIRRLDPQLTVYYCIDDLASSSPEARRISQSEARLFQEADLVFVTSEKLRQRAARFSSRVHLFPFGVDLRTFERVRNEANGVPEDLRALPRPVIGYVGGVHQWVDQELFAAVAARVPEASFVLVGPHQTDVSRLSRCPNIHLLGARSHADVPWYIKGFDVGVIPYRLSDYTANVYPTKLNEYLAMGIPVIATDLPEIRRFNAEFGSVVAVAQDPGEFAATIQQVLSQTAPGLIGRRFEAARQNSWEGRIGRMSELIEEALQERRAGAERWEEALRRLYRIARHRIVQVATGVALAYLLLFRSPFIWWLAEPLRMSSSPEPSNAIVVFAGGVGESGKAGGGYQERVKQAVDLYRAGMAPRMIFSSGYAFVFREAEVMRDLAVNQGVPPSVILLETKAANTFENVAFVNEVLERQGWRSILLVSSPYHMRRAVWTFRKRAPGLRLIPAPVPYSQFYAHGNGASLEQIRGILQEYAAIVTYWWNGWL
jgi:uncharacterized SAM-binding protein YcdF (DUF218 family)/glycosyltransferase involved in cell wall biosynthesis